MSEDRYSIRSVDRTIDIIACVAANNGALTIDQIVTAARLPKSTVFRILATLEARRFVERSPQSQTYRLGSLAVMVGARALGELDIRRIARPHIETLMEATGETVHLSMLNDDTALCIDKIDSTRSIRMSSYVGFRDPLHCSGVGKVLLAFQTEPERKAILSRITLTRQTPRTITDKRLLQQQLDAIRAKGFATDIEEIEEGVGCVAAPIYDHSIRAIASVSISGPTTRINETTLDNLIPLVSRCAAAISGDLGFTPEARSA